MGTFENALKRELGKTRVKLFPILYLEMHIRPLIGEPLLEDQVHRLKRMHQEKQQGNLRTNI